MYAGSQEGKDVCRQHEMGSTECGERAEKRRKVEGGVDMQKVSGVVPDLADRSDGLRKGAGEAGREARPAGKERARQRRR